MVIKFIGGRLFITHTSNDEVIKISNCIVWIAVCFLINMILLEEITIIANHLSILAMVSEEIQCQKRSISIAKTISLFHFFSISEDLIKTINVNIECLVKNWRNFSPQNSFKFFHSELNYSLE